MIVILHDVEVDDLIFAVRSVAWLIRHHDVTDTILSYGDDDGSPSTDFLVRRTKSAITSRRIMRSPS